MCLDLLNLWLNLYSLNLSLKMCSTKREEERKEGERIENLICYLVHKFYKKKERKDQNFTSSTSQMN